MTPSPRLVHPRMPTKHIEMTSSSDVAWYPFLTQTPFARHFHLVSLLGHLRKLVGLICTAQVISIAMEAGQMQDKASEFYYQKFKVLEQ